MALLSVCIPTWNGEAHLGRLLDSLLAQRDQELKIFLSDDCSDDGTLDLAYGYDDPRLLVLAHSERVGMAANFNRALWYGRGDYVAVVGQDDELDPDWARTLAGALDRHPRASLAFCRRRFAFASDRAREQMGDFFEGRYPAMLAAFYEGIGEVISPGEMVAAAMAHNFEINLLGEPAFVALRRDHPAVRQGFSPDFVQLIDWEFWSRFFVSGPIVHCPRELGTFHLHDQGESLASSEDITRHWREYIGLIDLVAARFDHLLTGEQKSCLFARRAEEVAKLAGGEGQ